MIGELIKIALASFFATLGYGIVLQAPKRSLLFGSLIGMIGYIIYWFLYHLTPLNKEAMFIASALASTIGQVAARKIKMPVTIFSIMAIIPLVPGMALYRGMSYLGEGMGEIGGKILSGAMIEILLIALGLGVGGFFVRVYYAVKRRKERRKALS